MKSDVNIIKLLHLLIFLNLDDILIYFLKFNCQDLSDNLWETIEDELDFHDILELLQQFSLIGLS